MWAQTPWGYSDWLSPETTCAAGESRTPWLKNIYVYSAETIFTGSEKKYSYSWTNLTHLLVPAGGWCDGIPLGLFCRGTTTGLCGWLQRHSAKGILLKIDLRIRKVVGDSFAGLSIHLNLMRSDVGDCGNPGCSFVDSSSERDAT